MWRGTQARPSCPRALRRPYCWPKSAEIWQPGSVDPFQSMGYLPIATAARSGVPWGKYPIEMGYTLQCEKALCDKVHL